MLPPHPENPLQAFTLGNILETRKLLAIAALSASLFSVTSIATAAPVVQALSSNYTIGQTVTFLVSDNDITQGDLAGLYAADFNFNWDPTLLKILPNPLTPSTGLASFISGGGLFSIGADGYGGSPDATNSGGYQVTLVGDMPAPSGAYDLFTLSFEALQSTNAATVTLSEVQGGSYGESIDPFQTTRALVTVTGTTSVPEPASWAMSALALVAAFLARRRIR